MAAKILRLVRAEASALALPLLASVATSRSGDMLPDDASQAHQLQRGDRP